jgi:hypothetical protein
MRGKTTLREDFHFRVEIFIFPIILIERGVFNKRNPIPGINQCSVVAIDI